jgi:hypothetical protein
MQVFRVGIRRMDSASVLRVNSLENARWLLGRLSDVFVFKTSEPLHEVQDSSDYTFCVAHNSQMSGPRFEKLLAGIAEVQVILERVQPASAVVA